MPAAAGRQATVQTKAGTPGEVPETAHGRNSRDASKQPRLPRTVPEEKTE